MSESQYQTDKLIAELYERSKELNCLYKVEEILNQTEEPVEILYRQIPDAICSGFQFPDLCQIRMEIQDSVYQTDGFQDSPWMRKTAIQTQDEIIGTICVIYLENPLNVDKEHIFLKEEIKLLNTIAHRISHFILYQRLKPVFKELNDQDKGERSTKSDWEIMLTLVHETDLLLYQRITQKMLYYLCLQGIKDAETLLALTNQTNQLEFNPDTNENSPIKRSTLKHSIPLDEKIYQLARQHLSNIEILTTLQNWILGEKTHHLARLLEDSNATHTDIGHALTKYVQLTKENQPVSHSMEKSAIVSLIRRVFTDQLSYIHIGKENFTIQDFYELYQRIIFPENSQGKLGGKSAGLLLAEKIIGKSALSEDIKFSIKTPKTWYITSDALMAFLDYNDLEEVIEHKYKTLEHIRLEYPYLIQVFKNALFPPEIIRGLSLALDDFSNTPLVVRSSSLLEDQLSASFAGKYKSLFVPNQGSKEERLNALTNAIAEIYASIFGPDPIEYRIERGLLDFREEMGILIQEVVGSQVGPYYFPLYAGVAFSYNEFRWSPRISRSDGLIRMVPGLGTRAVDRLSNDYPVLTAPGKPAFRVNVTPEEVLHYSPSKMDVINLETNTFETIPIKSFLEQYGEYLSNIQTIASIYSNHHIQQPIGFDIDFQKEEILINFEGLYKNTPFLQNVTSILELLKEELKTPVDIEFASEGAHFYLLQCRPQSHSWHDSPAPIPKDIEEKNIIFTANRYISNGMVSNITHIVYIDPEGYSRLSDVSQMVAVGRCVGKLNQILPKRQFVLIGPGRWGSRGDIKLGVNVTYADINNTAMLIEVARQKGNYIPDLSFGTHFFQDLVEAEIKYLPLYPDEPGNVFNSTYLNTSTHILSSLTPDFDFLSEVVYVIDIPSLSNNDKLHIAMNADLGEAIGYLGASSQSVEKQPYKELEIQNGKEYWTWRLQMAECIAAYLDPQKWDVKNMYVIGSTKNATAGPGSDIDILVHIEEDAKKQTALAAWLDGWSLCLDDLNYRKTGYRSGGLLDIHYVTDTDIQNKTSFAVKINAVSDAARKLSMGTALKSNKG